ncbi:MAG: hypothetical protein J5658_11395 [Prevotella sp.]|nr:hypothetical protein [Prevotella sp.]
MRKESILVVYDRCQATAEEIADKLGAEPVSVQVLNPRMLESARNFVLCITLEGDGQIPILWLYEWQTLLYNNINSKGIAILVNSAGSVNSWVVDNFCEDLRKNGAHIVGQVLYTGSKQWSLDDWIASISPNL